MTIAQTVHDSGQTPQADTHSKNPSASKESDAISIASDINDTLSIQTSTTNSEDEESQMLHKCDLLDDSELASEKKTLFSTLISFLGSGILGLPFAFSRTGILLGLVLLIMVATINTYCMLLLIKCKYELGKRGKSIVQYGDIGHFVLGRAGSWIVNAALILSQTGFCISYLIFIASNMHAYLNISRGITVAICLPPLIAISLIRHLKELAYIALLADAMNIAGIAVLYISDFSTMASDLDTLQVVGVVSSIPYFFGIVSYCFEGVGMVLPIEQSMQNKENFPMILLSTVCIITSIYGTFGICGYLAYGSAVKDVLTLNLEANSENHLLSVVTNFCLCIGLFFTYPIMLVPVFEILQPSSHTASLEALKEDSDTQSKLPKPLRLSANAITRIVRSSIVLLTGVLAASIPEFGPFISFIGSTCCSMLAYVLPTIFYLRIFDQAEPNQSVFQYRAQRLLLCIICAIGLLSMLYGFLML